MKAGIVIPTLCYCEKINEIGACRLCLVEIAGRDRLAAACNTVCDLMDTDRGFRGFVSDIEKQLTSAE